MELNINRRGQKRVIDSWEVQEGDRHISGREFTEQEIEYFKSKKPTPKKETKETTQPLASKKSKTGPLKKS